MRPRSATRAKFVALALAIASAALFGAASCDAEIDVAVDTGAAADEEFADHVEDYDFVTPTSYNRLEWVEVRNWDTNSLYLRIDTDRQGVSEFLAQYDLQPKDLVPIAKVTTRVDADLAEALPSGSGWGEGEFPPEVWSWGPKDPAAVRSVDQIRTDRGAVELGVDGNEDDQVIYARIWY